MNQLHLHTPTTPDSVVHGIHACFHQMQKSHIAWLSEKLLGTLKSRKHNLDRKRLDWFSFAQGLAGNMGKFFCIRMVSAYGLWELFALSFLPLLDRYSTVVLENLSLLLTTTRFDCVCFVSGSSEISC